MDKYGVMSKPTNIRDTRILVKIENILKDDTQEDFRPMVEEKLSEETNKEIEKEVKKK